MKSCFISYSRKDSSYAQLLFESLEKRGVNTFIDRKRILPGALFEETLKEQIQHNSFALIVIMSKNSSRSEWVEKEILWATQARVPIIPILLDGKPLKGLEQVNYVQVSNPDLPNELFYEAIQKLIPTDYKKAVLPERVRISEISLKIVCLIREEILKQYRPIAIADLKISEEKMIDIVITTTGWDRQQAALWLSSNKKYFEFHSNGNISIKASTIAMLSTHMSKGC